MTGWWGWCFTFTGSSEGTLPTNFSGTSLFDRVCYPTLIFYIHLDIIGA